MTMGMLDAPMRSVAKVVTRMFCDKKITITRAGGINDTYSPTAGTETVAAPKLYKILASPPFEYESREIDGESIKIGDMRMFVGAADLGIEPSSETDTVTYQDPLTKDDRVFRIVRSQRAMSGDEAAFYDLQLRGAR